MKPGAIKILLPRIKITEVANEYDRDTTLIVIPPINNSLGENYLVKPKYILSESISRESEPGFTQVKFNFFPIAMDANGVPWAEAAMYILDRLEGVSSPVMATYSNIAEDLGFFRRFLDDTFIDWTYFPSQKLLRPTYRFNTYLKIAVHAGEVTLSTAKRRMSTVIRFYRWIIGEKILIPNAPPWKESDIFIDFKDSHGFSHTKAVITTDVSIKYPKQYDPYDGTIEDGGKLRPLPQEEQEWVMDALLNLRNTEMTLIHLFGFITGARIQTILTIQVRHVISELADCLQNEIILKIGPGSGIDTKNNKQMVLHVPIWLYRMMHIYALSSRSKKRRERAVNGDNQNQYLFLSNRGAPFYRNKADNRTFNEENELRHMKSGQCVRQFITDRVIPFIRAKYSVKNFHYRFHDTRATAGMNWTDHQLKLVEKGKTTLTEVREFVKTRMGHESATTTDRYLQYRRNLKIVRWASSGYENKLKQLTEKAMNGLI